MERHLKILVVDDDADARLIMRASLLKAGFEVRLASGGIDALRQFRAEPCDLVMLDVDMPDMGGCEVCAILRAEVGPLLPIVMVTGMDDVASVDTAYQHGATDFVAKPVNWALIGHRVRYLFRGHQTMLDLRAAEARNAAVLDAIPDLLFELDVDGRCIDCRVPRVDMLTTPAADFLGRTLSEVLPPKAAEVCMSALQTAQANGFSSGAQIELPLDKASKWFELSVSRKAVAPGDKPRFIMLLRDITERKESESRITRLAYFDSLTGLPNRHSFLERVDGEVRRAVHSLNRLAVLFMDFDGFKNINDTMGHAAGDLILQMAAERLRDGLRPSDLLSRPMALDDEPVGEVDLARLGGDEFTALILDIACPEDALSVAQRLGQLMRRPFVLVGREVTLTTSIGIAVYPEDGSDGAALLKHADTAMYLAKRSGRDNAQLYSASLTQEILQRMELDANLRVALEREQFRLEYQPQIHVATGRIRSVEALIRWTHPVRGLVSPLDFISRAEEIGLIERIGHWVLRTACADAARWNRSGPPVRVAVNLSPLQFRAHDLPQLVAQVLAETGLAPELLELEVTEGALMEHSSATRATLQSLRDHGVHIALDDFGTGYSSLAYLTRMPIGHLKVDKCFVAGLLDGGESEAIVRAVLAMAQSLDMRVTAEGVETIEQALSLKAMACDYLQGFYFSRPLRAELIPGLLSLHWALNKPANRTKSWRAGHRDTPADRPVSGRAVARFEIPPWSTFDKPIEFRVNTGSKTVKPQETRPDPKSPVCASRGRRSVDGWLDRWIETVDDLARLKEQHPMVDAVIEEQRGRQIRVGDHWLTDWASCNYLGLDLDAEIIASIPEYISRWGTHPSWSRLLGSPRPSVDVEEQLGELLGCQDVMTMPTITHIHMSVLPVLAGDGTIFLDGRAHKTIYDGAMIAAGRGATVVRFRHDDAAHLEELIRASKTSGQRVIAMDGINSMTGNAPDLAAFSRIADRYDALLYVDDAHGFGVVGERSANEPCPYGVKGNSLFRHQSVNYENAVLVAGLSKAYSSLLAFLALPTRLKSALKVLAPPYLYSGPSPVASLATTLSGLEVNRKRGDSLRAHVWQMSGRILDALAEMGVRTPNASGLPIIEIPLARNTEIDAAGQFLFDRGIYVTMAAFPLVPKNEVGFRVQVTAANTDAEVTHLIAAIEALRRAFELQPATAAAAAACARG